ncbi:MAG: hypothetical protein RL090_1920 [Bacteroidota bacterium]
MTREQLSAIIRFSNLDRVQISKILDTHIYPQHASWRRFLKIALLTLGVGFLVSGIVFFFAYNWDTLPNQAKLIITQSLVAVTCLPYFIPRIDALIKNISLTASAILVGGMLAVFGQIYQTEAMAFDLMLSWTMAVTLWVVAARFAPLTLLWLILFQATAMLYYEQVLHQYEDLYALFTLSAINIAALVLAKPVAQWMGSPTAPKWFRGVVSVSAAYFILVGIVFMLEDKGHPLFFLHSVLTAAFLFYMTRSGIAKKDIASLVIAALTTIIAISIIVMLEINNDEPGLIFITVFILSTAVFSARALTQLKKKWDDQAQ